MNLLKDHFKNVAVTLTEVAMEGLEKDGSLIYETIPELNKVVKEKHWSVL